MALKAKPPEAKKKRFKAFMYSLAGIGKTTAAIQFPRPYIIDCERGTENYDRLINDGNGAVFQTTNFDDVVGEVRELATTKHDFRTLVIDPITPVYNDLLEKGEEVVGSANGRHYGYAGKRMKRLFNLLNNLDMNVILTAHAKKEYGQNMSVIGTTFDAWRALDHLFDLVVELQKRGKKRVGIVKKTRIEGFPDEDVFDWSYDEIKRRYGADLLERESLSITFASTKQILEMKDLITLARVPTDTVDKWFAHAGVDRFEDMPSDKIAKCIEWTRNRVPGRQPAEGAAADVPL